MFNRYIVAFLVCLLGIIQNSWAQADVVTDENIGHFSESGQGKALMVCNALSGKRRLGKLTNTTGAPSRIVPGAIFSPLSPSLEKRIISQRRVVNAAIKLSKRAKSRKARNQAFQRLRRAATQLDTLTNAGVWCDHFRPETPVEDTTWWGLPKIRSAREVLGGDDSSQGKTFNCSPTITGSVSGDATAIVTLGNDNWLQSQDASSGGFSFAGVPEGTYLLTAERAGYSFGPAHTVIVRAGSKCTGISFVGKTLTSPGIYAYQWRQRPVLRSGTERVTLLETPTTGQSTMSAASPGSFNMLSGGAHELSSKYNVTLDSQELTWSPEYAQRLLIGFKGLLSAFDGKRSVWILTNEFLNNDIEFTESDDTINVRVSADAFRYAASEETVAEGGKGDIGSFRLSAAILRFCSKNGRDQGLIRQILMQEFKVWVKDDPIEAQRLAQYTTGEGASAFQPFTGEELIAVTSAFANLPRAASLLNMPVSIVRRSNGVPHPRFGDAIAVVPQSGVMGTRPTEEVYLEFTQDAFRLIKEPSWVGEGFQSGITLHPALEPLLLGTLAAYAELVWDRSPNRDLVSDWITLGGWAKDLDRSEWKSADPTQVGSMLRYGVTSYGPAGDFATSFAQYIAAPQELASRSPARFEFIRTNLMRGLTYAREFREDLKIPVYNPRPDFSLPGRVKEASVVIQGAPNETKYVRVEITLEGTDPMESGAQYGMMYFHAPEAKGGEGQQRADVSVHLRAVKPDSTYHTSLRLEGRAKLPSFLTSGYYELKYLTLTDAVGNTRTQHNDFGFGFYLDNTATVEKPAALVKGTTTLEVVNVEREGTTVPAFKVQFRASDVGRLKYVRFSVNALSKTLGTFSPYDPRVFTVEGDLVTMLLPVTRHIPSGEYGLSSLVLDSEEQSQGVTFVKTDSLETGPYERMPIVTISNDDEDVTKPMVDLNNIKVEASPSNPADPNGETAIVITMRSKDDLSGIAGMSFCLRDPLDRVSCRGVYIPSERSVLPGGTTEWSDITAWTQLWAGSVGGIWGLDFIYIRDKAGNSERYQLSEIVKIPVKNNNS